MNRCLLLGAIFIVTNLLLWLPWLITDDLKFSLEGGKEVFSRIFPVRRGIFEDKVAIIQVDLASSSKNKNHEE